MSAEVIAFPDPVVVFKARYDVLNAQIDQDPEEADAISMRVVAIEDKIFAWSPAGAIAMIVVLREYLRTYDWSEWHEGIVANLIGGLERMTAQPSR
jgi:hypothetical protein